MPSPSRISFTVLAAAACVLLALPALADSQARIVRLSDVQGSVQIDKNTGLGFERAFLNLPITQGTHLRTGADGRAEIEFEDGSSMRIAPNTTVEFDRLGLTDSGKRISEVNLIDGMAYVNWMGKDDLALDFSHEKVSLNRSAHFRVETSSEVANLAVFKGDLEVEGPSGKLSVEKKKSARFDVAENDKSTVSGKIPEEPLDAWDKEAGSYHDQYAKNNNTSPYGYGLADLNYYGGYSNVPGYGMMWQPYFTGLGWDPFLDGAWGFYPGYGYMFASAYPWGWLPYRYGTWMFVPSYGWMWQPGMWTNFVTVPRYIPTAATRVTALVPPAAGTVRTVTVGRGGTISPASSAMFSRVTLHAGSAGMGIPRGSINDLNHLNHQVAKSGFAEVRPAAQFAATAPARSSSVGYAPERGSMSPAAGHSAPAGHSSGAVAGGGAVHH